MAGTDRKHFTSIEDELLANGRSFSFFQTLRLLNSFVAQNGNDTERLHTDVNISNIKISPNLSLAFPVSDVEKVKKIEPKDKNEASKYLLTANLLGMYGTCSPLPTFYTEELFDDVSKGNTNVKDFLDIINHRLYELLFAGWSKYRSMQKIIEERSKSHAARLFSLIGMGEEELRKDFDDPLSLLRYTGLLTTGARSASGLETILTDALGGITIKIIQAIERKGVIPVDQRATLGNNINLGANSQLGEECSSRTGSFRIEIGPVEDKEYRTFLPGGTNHKKLVALTDLYVSQPLEYDLDVILETKPSTICLGGDRWAHLGLDTWIYSKTPAKPTKDKEEIKEKVVETSDVFRSRFYPDNAA